MDIPMFTTGKQILRVLEAVNHGARTVHEVSAMTDMPIKHCSSYLSMLADSGDIRRVKRSTQCWSEDGRGARGHVYAPKRPFESAT